MVTKEQAVTARTFHGRNCLWIVGPRGGRRFLGEVWRRHGATQTYKRRPDAFRVPIKRGLWEYAYITESNARDFHVASECDAPFLNPD